MRDTNGICKRNTLGTRVHEMKIYTDAFGRKYQGCQKCGAVMVVTGRPTISYDERPVMPRGSGKKERLSL